MGQLPNILNILLVVLRLGRLNAASLRHQQDRHLRELAALLAGILKDETAGDDVASTAVPLFNLSTSDASSAAQLWKGLHPTGKAAWPVQLLGLARAFASGDAGEIQARLLTHVGPLLRNFATGKRSDGYRHATLRQLMTRITERTASGTADDDSAALNEQLLFIAGLMALLDPSLMGRGPSTYTQLRNAQRRHKATTVGDHPKVIVFDRRTGRVKEVQNRRDYADQPQLAARASSLPPPQLITSSSLDELAHAIGAPTEVLSALLHIATRTLGMNKGIESPQSHSLYPLVAHLLLAHGLDSVVDAGDGSSPDAGTLVLRRVFHVLELVASDSSACVAAAIQHLLPLRYTATLAQDAEAAALLGAGLLSHDDAFAITRLEAVLTRVGLPTAIARRGVRATASALRSVTELGAHQRAHLRPADVAHATIVVDLLDLHNAVPRLCSDALAAVLPGEDAAVASILHVARLAVAASSSMSRLAARLASTLHVRRPSSLGVVLALVVMPPPAKQRKAPSSTADADDDAEKLLRKRYHRLTGLPAHSASAAHVAMNEHVARLSRLGVTFISQHLDIPIHVAASLSGFPRVEVATMVQTYLEATVFASFKDAADLFAELFVSAVAPRATLNANLWTHPMLQACPCPSAVNLLSVKRLIARLRSGISALWRDQAVVGTVTPDQQLLCTAIHDFMGASGKLV